MALLAFNQIVITHPWLVAQQEDVILECIDSTDISIRIKALDLVQGMVSGDNLVSIVSRLMRQLKLSSSADRKAANSRLSPEDSDDEEEGVSMNVDTQSSDDDYEDEDDFEVVPQDKSDDDIMWDADGVNEDEVKEEHIKSTRIDYTLFAHFRIDIYAP